MHNSPSDTQETSQQNESLLSICSEVSPLLIGIMLLLMGVGLQGTLLGVRANMEGFTVFTTGIVMAAYYVGFLIGAGIVPGLIGRVGHVRTFASLGAVSSAAMLLYGLFLDPIAWAGIRIVVGFCFSGLFIVAESWLNDRAPNTLRGQLLSVYVVVHLLGLTIGQYLLGVSDPEGLNLFILISVLVSVAVVPCTLSSTPAPNVAEMVKMPVLSIIRLSPLGAYVVIINGVVSGVMYGMGAVYAVEIGLSTLKISSFIASYVLGGTLLQWPLGWLSDRVNRRGMIVVLTLISILAACAVAWVSPLNKGALLFASIFILGGTSMPLYSLGVSLVNDRLDLDQMVGASGALVFLFGLGAAAGPFAASILMATLGTYGLFYGVSVVISSVLIVAFWRILLSKAPSVDVEDQRNYFHIAPRGSGVALAVTMDDIVQAEEEKQEQEDDEASEERNNDR
ncbi:MFS transporter [Kordiimonas sediminis]|uniref:MFS transporter n=1 Tax=Kordiimonas sediminis TaxID=1735581 RepID=A0A919EA14_9PROT|nr:MFS transporter [Kordiimonas sediminis]GHF28966.1 MFS transporter [Kordiimonas sediminis]